MVTGEGVQSLARAFIAEGTGAVIAGWWNVNDAAAAQLMQGFYRRWVAGGETVRALRTSKLDWLNDPQVAYQQKLPYYWAALNYSGNPAPLKGEAHAGQNVQGMPSWIWWMIVLVVPGVVLLVIILRLRR